MCFAQTVSLYLRLNLLSCLVPHALLSCLHPSEPTNVELYVDGVSDICTKGGDINFVFTGFSVNGKVWLQNVVVFNIHPVVYTEASLLKKQDFLFLTWGL